jgi:hypothetical protein
MCKQKGYCGEDSGGKGRDSLPNKHVEEAHQS